jgi:hypothetical protein
LALGPSKAAHTYTNTSGEDCPLLSLDPSHNKPTTVPSRFPTISAYFSRFPHRTIAWAVDDFYKYQQAKYASSLSLLRAKHRWEWYESCWRFRRDVEKLRNECEGWFSSLHIPGRHSDDGERQRRNKQWEAVRAIAKRCGEVGIRFPAGFCPEGMTPRRYFCEDTTNAPEAATVDDAEVAREIAEMLKCETPEEYYRKHPYPYTPLPAPPPPPEMVAPEDSTLREPASDSSSSLDLDEDGMPGTFPGAAFQDATGVRIGYSASVDGRLESVSFHQVEVPAKDSPPERDRNWRSVRVRMPPSPPAQRES